MHGRHIGGREVKEYIIYTIIVVGTVAYYLHHREMKKKNNEIENLKKKYSLEKLFSELGGARFFKNFANFVEDIYNLCPHFESNQDQYIYLTIDKIISERKDLFNSWLANREKLVNRFGNLSSRSQVDRNDRICFEKLLKYSDLIKQYPELNDIVNYIRINGICLRIIIHSMPMHYDKDDAIKEFAPVFPKIMLAANVDKTSNLEENLQILEYIYKELHCSDDSNILNDIPVYYEWIKKHEISIDSLNQLDEYISEECRQYSRIGYDYLMPYDIAQEIFKRVVKTTDLPTNITFLDFMKSEMRKNINRNVAQQKISILREMFYTKLNDEQKNIFEKICLSDEIINSISELHILPPRLHEYPFFKCWFPVILSLTSTYLSEGKTLFETFRLCRDMCDCNSYDLERNRPLGVTGERIKQIKFEIEKFFAEENEKDRVEKNAIESPNELYSEEDVIKYSHATHCFDENEEFDYLVVIKRISQKFSDSDITSIEDFLILFPEVKIICSGVVKAFRYGINKFDNNIRMYIQNGEATRNPQICYRASSLQHGENALKDNLIFSQSKEGVWEYFLLNCIPRFYGANGHGAYNTSTFIFSSQQVPKVYSQQMQQGDFDSWSFEPKILEDDQKYIIEYVTTTVAYDVFISMTRTTIDKKFPHDWESVELKRITANVKIFF